MRSSQHTEDTEQFGEGRSEVLNHLSEHYHRTDYEKQGGAHAYWYKPKGKNLTVKDLHKHLKSKGVHTTHSDATSYSPATLRGKHGKHGFEISEQGNGHIHVRFHRTHADKIGKDTDAQFTEEIEQQYSEDPYVRNSRHHRKLRAKGFKHQGSGSGGWVHYYRHPNGTKARLSFSHANDTDGSLSISRKKSSQHTEDEGVEQYSGYEPVDSIEVVPEFKAQTYTDYLMSGGTPYIERNTV